MHPDYLDYVQKRKVRPHAKVHDVKLLCCKLLAVEFDSFYVQRVDYFDWIGWIIEFSDDVDLAELRRVVFGVLILGNRACYIGEQQ